MPSFYVQVLDNGKVVFANEFDRPVEIGRQTDDDPEAAESWQNGDTIRLVVAERREISISRRQLRIESLDDGIVQLINISESRVVRLPDTGGTLSVGESVNIYGPTAIEISSTKSVSIVPRRTKKTLYDLPEATLAPGETQLEPAVANSIRTAVSHSKEPQSFVRALQFTMDVFQHSDSPERLFETAVKSVVKLVGLDSASVVLYEDEVWKQAFPAVASNERLHNASRTILARVCKDRRTFWDPGLSSTENAPSLKGIRSVIAAPILAPGGGLRGALYGDLNYSTVETDGPPLTKLDASLVELLACGVASGLARLEHEVKIRQQEANIRRLRVQFEQFFTPELARELESHPNLLEGREADVTILFCDIRGFSRISERVGPSQTFQWINDVMGVLSESVTKYEGVLVDYIGDALMAMWGAPRKQDDHAELACRAALDMLERLPAINERWQAELGDEVGIGVGVNSGRVRAGNSGSKYKFKYGPLGSPVNLASRIQGATKHLKSQALISGSTEAELSRRDVRRAFQLRRLCDVCVVNIEAPVRLLELVARDQSAAADLCAHYEEALDHFEQRQFRQSSRVLSNLLNSFPDDGPSLLLLSRAVDALVGGADAQHPVWQLSSK